jgi:hypothetical protein
VRHPDFVSALDYRPKPPGNGGNGSPKNKWPPGMSEPMAAPFTGHPLAEWHMAKASA